MSEEASASVGTDGLFEVNLHAMRGIVFRPNLACDLVFMPTFPKQPASVLMIVGKHGEHLDFPKNPQTRVGSGDNYYLVSSIHVL
jgi:hypothetical protein